MPARSDNLGMTNFGTRRGVAVTMLMIGMGLAACGMPAPTNAPIANPYGVGSVPLAPPAPTPTPSAKAVHVVPKAKPAVKPASHPSAAPTPTPTPTPAATLLVQAQAKYLALRSYTADVQSYGKSQGKDIGAKAKLSWKAPNRLRMEILDTNISNGDRTVVVDTGTTQVRVKAPGWWPFPLSVDRGDPKLQLAGGPRYDEATLGGVLGYASADGAEVTAQGDIDFQGRTVTEFHVRSPQLTARGLSYARLGLDPATQLPVFCEHVGPDGIVTQLIFSNVVTDGTIADDQFTL